MIRLRWSSQMYVRTWRSFTTWTSSWSRILYILPVYNRNGWLLLTYCTSSLSALAVQSLRNLATNREGRNLLVFCPVNQELVYFSLPSQPGTLSVLLLLPTQPGTCLPSQPRTCLFFFAQSARNLVLLLLPTQPGTCLVFCPVSQDGYVYYKGEQLRVVLTVLGSAGHVRTKVEHSHRDNQSTGP